MSVVVVGPLLVALFTAIVTLALRRWGPVQRAASLVGSILYLGVVALLIRDVRADEAGYLVYQLSNWQAPYGISLVADDLAVLMLALTAVVSLLAVVFSARYIDEEGQRLSYHPLYHLMVAGITGSFLTGDIFNLFVWFEVMLMSSYVLVVFYSGPEETRAALHYAFLNLIGSAVMLLAIGGLYATTGTLNMADMAQRLGAPGQYGVDLPAVLGLSALLLSVFALKAGIVPFQFWVPDAYRAAPAPVAAMLAGVVKKVGVYAIIRLYFTVFAAASLPNLSGFGGGGELGFLAFFGPVFFLMALGSVVVGGFGAVARKDLDGLLAYSSIGQVGFIVLPLAVAASVPADSSIRTLGVVAALVYSVNHGIAKSLLFFVSGAIQGAVGSVDFEDLGGLAEREPLLSGTFFVGALALIGIPPLSGFFGKLLVFDAAVQAQSALALGVSLGGAILTIAYFTLAWSRGFWSEPGMAVEGTRADRSLVGVAAVLAVLIVVFGVGFGPLLELAEDAAVAATETQGYIDAVLGGEA
ncbi:complex I subunit 5 family protein [Halomarina litorea]|uniref:complex I subunit 5 family protein n=1 Tax=Halomarina litorea TaxID=2961595 RepID=UPI0020C516F1|nr:proton-conducting transporter membrane subunit [Halomarina sp. BCD28]